MRSLLCRGRIWSLSRVLRVLVTAFRPIAGRYHLLVYLFTVHGRSSLITGGQSGRRGRPEALLDLAAERVDVNQFRSFPV